MIWSAIQIAVCAYVGLILVLYFMQGRMIYHPTRELTQTPESLHLEYEDVWMKASDGVKIHGWFMPAENSRGALLMCHGNAGNVSHRVESAALYQRMGLDVLVFDYRGYGQSEGSPSEKGTYADAEAAWDYLTVQRGIRPDRIVILGRSLGGAIASHLAIDHTPAALVLESAFSSVGDMGASLYPYLPVRLLSRYRYDTADYVSRVSCPVLVMHGPGDEIVPFELGKKIFAAAKEPKQFAELAGGHNDGQFATGQAYVQTLDAFVTANLATK